MDRKAQPVVCRVINLVLSERHVADSKVEEIVWIVCFFVSADLNLRLWIQQSCNAATDTVQLYTIQLRVFHVFRKQAEEVANAAGRLQNVAALEAHAADGCIDCVNYNRAGVVCI